MLSAEQLDFLRIAMRLPVNARRSAWKVDTIKLICRPYDKYKSTNGSETFDRVLVKPQLISVSPDGLWCKLTDYGRALYEELEAMQRDWEEAPIISLDDAEKDQIIIRPGETFRGKFFLIQVFKRAHAEIRLQDNFCAHELLAWLYDISPKVAIHILTSHKGVKQDRAFEPLYRSFKNDRSLAELRLADDMHDRMVIIDDREAFQVGESFKDIGRKGTTITRLKSVPEHVAQFAKVWEGARPL